MVGEAVPHPEQEPTAEELRRGIEEFIESEGIDVDPRDMDWLFSDGETGEPRDFEDVEGGVVGWFDNLYQEGTCRFDGHEVLAEIGILESER